MLLGEFLPKYLQFIVSGRSHGGHSTKKEEIGRHGKPNCPRQI